MQGKRKDPQREQRALVWATRESNESKDFDAVKKAIEQSHYTQNVKKNH